MVALEYKKEGIIIMVDPVGPSGSVSNISQVNRTTQRQNNESEDVRAAEDTVSISPEAISLAEAEQLATQIGGQIAQDTDVTLSNGSERLNALV